MKKSKKTNQIIVRRKNRTRAKIFGTSERPRLTVFRSNLSSYVQIIDDEKRNTLVSASTKEIKKEKVSAVLSAKALGELIAKRAAEKGIKKIVFDRGNYRYHGRVKAIAEGARAGGLEF